MKLKILTSMAVAALTTGAFGQDIILDNAENYPGYGNPPSPTATSGGVVYIDAGGTTSLFNGNTYNLGVTVYGGPDASDLTSLGTFTPLNDPKSYTGFDYGTFQLGPAGAAVPVPGVTPGDLATIELQIWDYDDPNATGTFQTYAAAVAGNDYVATVIFQNPTSTLPSHPVPLPPQELYDMPSVVLSQVPEPSAFALAGLGVASLLVLCRPNRLGRHTAN